MFNVKTCDLEQRTVRSTVTRRYWKCHSDEIPAPWKRRLYHQNSDLAERDDLSRNFAPGQRFKCLVDFANIDSARNKLVQL